MRKTFDARHRPFVLPSSLSELDGPTEAGEVVLPTHLDWSSGRRYDLDDPLHRRRVYEIVLREGTLDDLRRFVDANALAAVFDDLYLPEDIRTAWRRLLVDRAA